MRGPSALLIVCLLLASASCRRTATPDEETLSRSAAADKLAGRETMVAMDSLLESPKVGASLRMELRKRKMSAGAGDPLLVLVQTSSQVTKEALAELGAPGLVVRSVVGTTASATATTDALFRLIMSADVVFIELSKELRPT